MTTQKMIGGTHYLKDIQPWDAMRSWWGSEAFSKYCMMTSIKYIMREKGNKVEDLEKAIHYLEAAIEELSQPNEEADHLAELERGYAKDRM